MTTLPLSSRSNVRHFNTNRGRNFLRSLLLGASVVVGMQAGEAQGAFILTGTTYTQNFDGLGTSTGSAVTGGDLNNRNTNLNGWYFLETGSSANTTITAGTGSSATGDTYNFGTASGSDRALGGLLSSNLVPSWGFYFTNDTGSTITDLAISFLGETWRIGATGRSDRLDFQYSADATSLSTGTWTDFNALDYANPSAAATANGSLLHSATISSTLSSLSIANGASFFLRWTDFNASGSDDGMAIDDFSLTATLLPTGTSLYWLGSDTNRGGAGTWANTGGSAWSATDADGTGAAWDSTKTATFNTAAATVTVSGTVDADKGITFAAGSNGSTISGGTAIDLGGATAADNTISTASSITATIGTNLTGSAGMTKADSGTLVLTGDKTYTGGTTISAGTLQLGDGTTNGSVLGAITNNASLAVNNGSAQTLSNDIAGTGALLQSGPGVLTLSGTNSYSGGTTVSGGGLVGTTSSLQGAITNNSAVTFDQGTSGTYAGNMTGSGSLTKLGSGNVTLSGTNAYSGGTTVTAGTLTGTTSSLQGAITNNAAVVFDQGTTGTYAGNMTGSGSLTKSGSGNVTLGGTNAYSGGTTVSAGTLTGTTTSLQGDITNNAAVVFNQATTGTYAGEMTGTGTLTKSGSGMVTLNGNNSFSGGTSVSGGTLVAANNNVLGSGSVDVSGSTLLANSGVTVGNAITVDAGVGSPQLVAYWNFNSLSIATASSPGSGGVPLSIAANQGSGTLSLANWGGLVDDFSGDTINALSGDPAEESLSLVSNAGNGSYIQISGLDFSGLTDARVTFATRGTSTGFNSGQWAYSTDGAGFTDFGVNTANTSTTFALADSGTTGGINNAATGYLRYTLDGATNTVGNNRIDNLQVTASSLTSPTLGSSATSGTATFLGNITLDSSVQLTSASGGTVEFSGIIANGANGAKGITKIGDGVVVLGGDNTYTGATQVNAGTLFILGDHTSATGDVTVASGATLVGTGTVGGNTTIAGTHAAGNSIGKQSFDGNLSYSADSVFSWELTSATSGRGTNYDAVNVGGTLGGSGAVFRAVLTGGESFGDGFWTSNRTWTDIFMNSAEDGSLSFASIFSSIEYFEGSTDVTASIGSYGSFTISGSSLTWTAIPEPSTALAGILLGAGLLRRRRR